MKNNSSPGSFKSYDLIAPLYDVLGALYTGGGISRAKREHIGSISPSARILYAGAGTGAECVLAAQSGATITVVELSRSMLGRCEERFKKAGLNANFVHGDALSAETKGNFDLVVAPFFLNTFSKDQVANALQCLSKQVRKGGRLLSIDFAAPSPFFPFRLLQYLYYLPPLVLFRFLANNPWHGLYDYEQIAHKCPLRLTGHKKMKAWGVPVLECIEWEKC